MKQWMRRILILTMTVACIMLICMAQAEEAEGTDRYVFRVEDQNEEPVENALVNICTDTECQQEQTDADGLILYEGKPDQYHLQVLEVPEGYSFDESEKVYAEDTRSETDITVIRETEGQATHVIRVLDQNGKGVPGVYVNICTDTLCAPMQTDDKGQIIYVGQPVVYHLQMIKAPDGIKFDQTLEYYTQEQSGKHTLYVEREP